MKKYILAFVLILLVSCTNTADIMNSWLGSDDTQLMSSWGAPTHVAEARSGGKIYTYRSQVFNSWSGAYQLRVRSFTVDKDGIITHVMWQN